MSKSGVATLFGTKERLQLATVEAAAERFREAVMFPARVEPRGIRRIALLLDLWIAYSRDRIFPGGCFFAATSVEFSHRPGPVRDRIEEMLRSWLSYLEHAVEQAQEAGELVDTLSAREITFELDSFGMAANWQYRVFGDAAVYDNARRAIRERLESLRPA